MSKIIRKSVQDTSDQVRASFNNIADAGQALVAPIPEKERANAPDQFKRRAEDFLRSFQTAGRELYNQGNANVRSFAIAEKGMAESTDEVLKYVYFCVGVCECLVKVVYHKKETPAL